MAVCPAWLLAFGDGQRAAVGLREVVHVLPDPPSLFRVPRTPRVCESVFLWQGRITPLVDPAGIAGGTPPHADMAKLVVVAYHDVGDGAVKQGGLILDQVPERVVVDDENALAPDDVPAVWTPFACGGYLDKGEPIPILDLSRVFSRHLVAAA